MAYSKDLVLSDMIARQRKSKEMYILISFMNIDAACFNKILINVTCEYVRSAIRSAEGDASQMDSLIPYHRMNQICMT